MNLTGKKVLLLLIIPVYYFFLSSYFHENIGLYSLRTADPEYIYYICGVSIANGHMEVGNIDHPGTTLQYFLAASFRITHWIRTTNSPFTEDILANPDLYLKVANTAMNFAVVIVMLFLGFLSLTIFPNIWYAILLQFTPFVSDIVYSNMGRVTPETIMPVFIMLLSVFTLSLVFRKNDESSWKTILTYGGIFALVLALKLTFAFLVLIPLFIIPGWKKKLYFLMSTLVIFLLFAIPVTLQLDYFWNWIKSLLLFSGQYGSGEKNIVKINEFIPNIVNLYKLNHIYFKFTFLFLILFLTTFFLKRKSTDKLTNNLSLVLSIVIFIQVLALGKHFKTTYFIPALLLLPMLVILSAEYLKIWTSERFRKYIPVSLAAAVIFFFLHDQRHVITHLSNHFEKQSSDKMKAYHYMKSVENESTKIYVVGFYGAPSEEYALMTSYQWAGKDKAYFYPTFAKLYPNSLMYYPWDKTFNSWGPEPDFVNMERPVYLYFENDNYKDEFLTNTKSNFPEVYKMEKTFSNPETNESVYRITKLVSE